MSTKTFGYEALLKEQRDRNVKMIGRVFRTQLKAKIDSGSALVTVKALESEEPATPSDVRPKRT